MSAASKYILFEVKVDNDNAKVSPLGAQYDDNPTLLRADAKHCSATTNIGI